MCAVLVSLFVERPRMKTLGIDIETFSPQPLGKSGAYRYAADPDFDVLLFAYSIDDGPVEVIGTGAGEKLPAEIMGALTDPAVTKFAFNAAFERVCLTYWLRKNGHLGADQWLDPDQWRCSMVWATALGLPRSLKNVAQALKLDHQKLDQGKKLIEFFSMPVKVKDSGAQMDLLGLGEAMQRNRPSDDPEKWAQFAEYCAQDVEVENELRAKLGAVPLPDLVWEEYGVDQRINDRGIRLDLELAQAAVKIDAEFREHCLDEARELTGLDNPASPTQLLEWLHAQGTPVQSMAKEHIEDALGTAEGTVKRVLELRQDLSRSSVAKYQSMLNSVAPDGRAHGLLQFHGAGRTGRWAGRLIQVQNLPRNYLKDLDVARQAARAGDADNMEMLFDSVPDTLSQLIRTAFIPTDGTRFIVADYSAIEARVLAWLAGQASTLNAFREGKDLYCETASAMFGVPVEKHGPNAELRQKGKIAVLACGYQGGVGAMQAMGAERMGIPESELQPIVDAWRAANDRVVDYWWAVDSAAKDVIRTGQPIDVGHVTLSMRAGALRIELPSGRALSYPGAAMGTNRFGKPSMVFKGIHLNQKFQHEETYGGKLVENITQAVARDLLAHALGVLERAGHRVVMHVHDEAVIEAPPETSVDEICELMADAPAWARGLPMTADGYDCTYYMKD